jgi:hypothetical protein
MYFCQALLISVHQILREVLQLLGHNFQCLHIVCGQFNLLPQILRGMCPFDRLHIEITNPFFLPNSGISTVRQGTRAADAETGHIVWVLAEGALLGHFALEGTELMIDDLPNNFVVDHDTIFEEKICEICDNNSTFIEGTFLRFSRFHVHFSLVLCECFHAAPLVQQSIPPERYLQFLALTILT